MALSALESTTIQQAMAQCNVVIQQLKPVLDELNVIVNSSGGVASTLTQENLDATPSLSGITLQQVKDAFAGLTGTLLNDIIAAYAQLAQLAARGAGQ